LFYDPRPIGLDYDEILTRAASLPDPIALGGSRVTVHFQTTSNAVDDLIALISQLADEKKQAGFVKPVTKHQNNIVRDVYVRKAKIAT
jgi:threonine aldolase